ncbi:MAG: hypothetical protein Q8R92_12040 [Deltaproteobacteria bacterium]|nr:hypothetical protein [Deltaproteobacteria bacterium]
MSAILSTRQVAVLGRIGDIMIPGGGDFPRFSDTGCLTHIDPLLRAMPPEDLAGLKGLLSILSFLPAGLLGRFLHFVAKERRGLGPVAGALRNIDLGLKGLVMSTYYSNRARAGYAGPRVFDAMGFALRVVKP